MVGSILERFGDEVRAHLQPGTDPVVPEVVVDLLDIDDAAQAVVDERFRDKQPDWTYDATWSGKSPGRPLHRPSGPPAVRLIVGTTGRPGSQAAQPGSSGERVGEGVGARSGDAPARPPPGAKAR